MLEQLRPTGPARRHLQAVLRSTAGAYEGDRPNASHTSPTRWTHPFIPEPEPQPNAYAPEAAARGGCQAASTVPATLTFSLVVHTNAVRQIWHCTTEVRGQQGQHAATFS